jgi:hypothetical protein
MAYSTDLPAAAHRHLQAADALYDGSRHRSVSGYLYGIAAECAVKALMRDVGLKPLEEAERRNDPFYAHFPALRTLLRDGALPRLGKGIRQIIEDDSFMSQWDTAMRYSRGPDIRPEWVARWREQARQAVSSIGA